MPARGIVLDSDGRVENNRGVAERDELVLCAGTLMGAGVRALCEAAAAGGFGAVTLWPQDVRRARAEGTSDRELRALLADHDLVVAELDPLLTWLPGEQVPAEVAAPEEEFYALAELVGARSLNLAQGFGAEIDLDRAAEALAGVCDRAADHGLRITLEYLPWSGIPDAATALAVVERSGRANAGVMIDTWHTFRGPTDAAQLRALPAERIGSVQLSDAPAAPAEDLVVETMEARLLPGEGDAPLAEWLRILEAKGSGARIGVEVFSRVLASLPPAELGRRCGEAARRVLAAARA
jgi:sugar phosphate isomerase/epimerase